MVLLYIACALTISDFEIVSVVTMLIWISIPALAIYIYDMISGMSRADVKNVLLIMHIDSVILGVVPHT